MKGTMSERSPQSWRLRVYIGDDPATGRPRQVSRTFKGTKKHARPPWPSSSPRLPAARSPVGGSTALSAYLDQWLTTSRLPDRRRPSEATEYKVDGSTPSSDESNCRSSPPSTLDRTYREWLDEGLSPRRVHHLHGVLSAALSQAVKWGLAPTAVTQRTSPPPLRTTAEAAPNPARDPAADLGRRGKGSACPRRSHRNSVNDRTPPGRAARPSLGRHRRRRARRSTFVGRSRTTTAPGWVIGPPKTHQERDHRPRPVHHGRPQRAPRTGRRHGRRTPRSPWTRMATS